MKVLITGGAGFLGQELCKLLLRNDHPGLQRTFEGKSIVERVEKIVLFDIPGAFDAFKDAAHCKDPRVECATGSIDDDATMRRLIDTPGMSVFHLAGIMSGQAEKDFDMGMRVNLEGTRVVLEAARVHSQAGGRLVRVVFASSMAIFGETLDCPVSDVTKPVSMNTYGMTKAVGEMFVNDYTRKRFVDGCSARLPTVIIRPGKPNAATTGAFSGVVREPLKGIDVVLPLERTLPHACTSTRMLVANLQRLHDADLGAPGSGLVDRGVMLPSISVTIQMLIDALYRVVPKDWQSKLGKISDKIDPFLNGVVSKMAVKELTHHTAAKHGLLEVPDVDTIVREYIEDHAEDCLAGLPAACAEPAAKKPKLATTSSGKVAVVTGGGSGIGRACAIALAKCGFSRVVVTGRRRDCLDETAKLIKDAAADADVLVMTCDVSREQDVERLFKEVEHRFGRCDLLFNNAGVVPKSVDFDTIALSDWKTCIDANVTGMFLCSRAAFGLMRRQTPQGGRIINNGSISADRPRAKMAAYTTSKHAVTGLTKQLALDGRPFSIACGQIDIGNAKSRLAMLGSKDAAAETKAPVEPFMDLSNVARTIEYMASLPPEANALFLTVMATNMPLIGRG
eukprot:TRINITY_DN51872_c0_g1_i3.p1 TRINITY_DN51872_c0_g1~~TRINITY_DN51872_c0_g1_i3.p1  ORF type:complete len:622 (-),score=160.08 TRINITY_DN51872_c0_g1_i3:207-2072(-)